MSKSAQGGYLLIDHRESPGLTDAQLHAAGLPIGTGRGLFEADTCTCSHCCRVVVLNPLRTRPREWCAKCDKYICDGCSKIMAMSGECVPYAKIVDQIQAETPSVAIPFLKG